MQMQGMIFICLLISTALSADIILEDPVQALVPLNSPATFNCTVDAASASIIWNIRTSGNLVLTLPALAAQLPGTTTTTTIHEGNITRAELSIEGLAVNNGTEVICTVLSPNFSQSAPAYLVVYGPPSPPSNLSVTPLSHLTLDISWSKPFIQYDTIPFSYQLQIFNGDNVLIVEQNLDSNTTDYILSIASEEEICRVYTFKVQSVNDAGYGSAASTTGVIPHVPYSISQLSHTTTIDDDCASIELSFYQPPSMCYPATQYQVDISQTVMIYSTHNVTLTDGGRIVLPEITGLMQDGVYDIAIALGNVAGVGEAIHETILTTDIQMVQLHENNNCTTTVLCIFAAGSLASGCLVTIKSTDTTTEYAIQRGEGALVASRNIPLQDESFEAYTIEAVGIEWDGNETDINYVWTQYTPNKARSMCSTSAASEFPFTSSGVVATSTSIMTTATTVPESSSTSPQQLYMYILVIYIIVGVVLVISTIIVFCTTVMIAVRIRKKRSNTFRLAQASVAINGGTPQWKEECGSCCGEDARASYHVVNAQDDVQNTSDDDYIMMMPAGTTTGDNNKQSQH